ncbi:MAG: DegT/DnrJ/EryC1/StrS family aminotransferase [bacterium]
MKIPWAHPWLDENEREELIAAFDSTWLSMGPRTKLLEERMQHYIGGKHAIAVSNGTDALDLALKALNVGPGDEVIVPAMTYVATVNSVLYQHATPLFADIQLETFNIDPCAIEQLITKKTKCIMYIDYGGNPADHKRLQYLSKQSGIPLLQDAAQSLGGESDGEKLCKQGLVSTTSFHIAKLMTTIEGGMVFTEDDNIATNIRMMRNQGEDLIKKYIHKVLGTNSRMTDLHAAIGLRQMDKFEQILKKREQIAQFYYSCFSSSDKITLPIVKKGNKCGWFFSPILVENRDKITKELNDKGIATRIAYPMPVYEQEFFIKFRKPEIKYDCLHAKWMTERVINLPMFHTMTEKQLHYIVENVLAAVNKYV